MMGKNNVFGCGTVSYNSSEIVEDACDINFNDFKCEFFNKIVTDDVCSNSTLAFKMDDYDQDFCICCKRRNSFLSANVRASLPDGKVSLPRRNAEFSFLSRIGCGDVEHDRTIFGSEELEISHGGGFSNEDVNISSDDVPLLLGDNYESVNEQSDHCHVVRNIPAGIKNAKRKLIISSILCLIFMLAEIIGGYLSNSLAIMTDAAHLLSDLASFLISLFAIYLGQKPPTRKMSFGFYRAEILGAVMSVLLIWVLTGILVYMAVERAQSQDYDIDANIMLVISGAGVLINIIMGLVLHGPCGSHSHGHSHGSPSSVSYLEEGSDSGSLSQNTQNINIRAAFIHVIGDLVQSVGVLIAAIIIHYKPEYKLADLICTFIFSVLVMFTTFSIMKDAVHVLMEGFPKNLNYTEIKSALENLKGVKSVHNLHIWSLTVDKNSLSVHLAVDPDADVHSVLKDAQTLMRRTYNIYHATIQTEKYESSYMDDCKTCQGPSG